MENREKGLSVKTPAGCRQIIAILIAIILACSFIAQMISTNGGQIKIEKVAFDVRGASLSGELYYPAFTTDEDSYPAVVVVAGAGIINYQMRSFGEELAKKGYVVLNLNAYGSGASETPVYNENDQGVLEYNIFGTPMGSLDAVHYLRTVEFIDSERIGLVGHSQGSRRAGYAALMDCGYYSFNDVMLNVLYEKFNIDLTEEQLSENADAIASDKLNADQLLHYNTLKEEYYDDYRVMVKSICLVGSTAQYVYPTSMVNVAGHDVLRSCKVNIGIINGTYDFGYVSFNNSEDAKNGMYIPVGSDIIQGGYYTLDDLTNTSTNIGMFRQDTINTNDSLRNAIENRSLRVIMQTGETHSKNFFSRRTSAMIVDYFNQTLNNHADILQTGESSITFVWREIFNAIAMLSMILMLFPLIRLLTSTKTYASCIAEGDTIQPEKNRLWGKIIITVATVIGTFIAIYQTNAGVNLINFKFSSMFPLMITCWPPYSLMVWLAVVGIVLMVIYLLCTKDMASTKEYFLRHFTIGISGILKSLVIAALLIIAGYVAVSVVNYFFLQDFQFWMTCFPTLTADQWLIVLRYALLGLPFFFICGFTTNYLADVTLDNVSGIKDTLITMVINASGIWLCCLVSNVLTYTGILEGRSFSSFLLTYGTIVFVPISVFVARRCYQITKNVWVGTFVNSMLLAWMIGGVSGTNGAYVAQTWFGNFLG